MDRFFKDANNYMNVTNDLKVSTTVVSSQAPLVSQTLGVTAETIITARHLTIDRLTGSLNRLDQSKNHPLPGNNADNLREGRYW